MNESFGSEAAVVGSLLVEPNLFDRVKIMLKAEHFSDLVCGSLYERIGKMREEGEAVDVVTVTERANALEKSKAFWLAENVPTALNIEHYANHVLQKYHERQLKQHYSQAIEDPSDEHSKFAIKELWRDAEEIRIDTNDLTRDWLDYTDEVEKRAKGKLDYFRTRFPTLDGLTGGGHSRGDFVCFAARPSVGKTSLLTKLALTFSRDNRRVLFLSAEMSKTQIRDRMVAQSAGLELFRVRNPKGEIPRIVSAISAIQHSPLFIVEGRLRLSRFARLAAAYKPDVIVFDYMQLFSPEIGQKADNKTQFLNQVSNELKLFARERNILLVGGVQINRQAEANPDREPTLANLKDAGGIEEAADVVVLMHRKSDEPTAAGLKAVDFIVAKDRNGAVGRFKTVFIENTTDFREREFEDQARKELASA